MITRQAFAVLMLMISGYGYDYYTNIKYGNCKIRNFELIDISSNNEIIVNAKIPQLASYKQIKVKIDSFFLPSKDSSSACEREANKKIKTMIYRALETPSAYLFLNKCTRRTDGTSGSIYLNNEDLIKKVGQEYSMQQIGSKRLFIIEPKRPSSDAWCKFISY